MLLIGSLMRWLMTYTAMMAASSTQSEAAIIVFCIVPMSSGLPTDGEETRISPSTLPPSPRTTEKRLRRFSEKVFSRLLSSYRFALLVTSLMTVCGSRTLPTSASYVCELTTSSVPSGSITKMTESAVEAYSSSASRMREAYFSTVPEKPVLSNTR